MNFYEFVEKNKLVKPLSNLKENELEETSILDYFQIAETPIKYNKYSIGDIVFVQEYKYKNGVTGNNHIFIIVDIQNSKEEFLYYGMILSSKTNKISFSSNILIKKDRHNNLNKDSIVKTDVIYKKYIAKNRKY